MGLIGSSGPLGSHKFFWASGLKLWLFSILISGSSNLHCQLLNPWQLGSLCIVNFCWYIWFFHFWSVEALIFIVSFPMQPVATGISLQCQLLRLTESTGHPIQSAIYFRFVHFWLMEAPTCIVSFPMQPMATGIVSFYFTECTQYSLRYQRHF